LKVKQGVEKKKLKKNRKLTSGSSFSVNTELNCISILELERFAFKRRRRRRRKI